MRTLINAICGVICGGLISNASGQQSEEAVKPLIVMLDVKFGDVPEYGAGIIMAVSANRLYIATANHVVRKKKDVDSGDFIDANSIQVGFSWLPGEPHSARLLSTFEGKLDLAVIVVDKASELGIPQLAFHHFTTASSLKKGDHLYPMGYANRARWSRRGIPDAFDSVQDIMRFDTSYVVQGNSGGALLTSSWRIAGLVTAVEAGKGYAIPIERLMTALQAMGHQVHWKPSPDGPAQLTFRDWQGSWNLQFEFEGKWYPQPMTVRSNERGITGDYGIGRISGEYAGGDVSKVTGQLENTAGTGTTCASGKQTGSLSLVLESGGKSMSGLWDVCGAGKKYHWKAEKRQ
jgi:hypothetical protein